MRQSDFAERLGISQQQLHKYETGRSRLSAARLYEISEMLGAPITTFFAGAPAVGQPGGVPADAIVSERAQPAYRPEALATLDKCIGYLSPAEQKALADLAMSIAEAHGYRAPLNGRDGQSSHPGPREAH